MDANGPWLSQVGQAEDQLLGITPPKINESNLKMIVWKMFFLFQGWNLSGSMLIFPGDRKNEV